MANKESPEDRSQQAASPSQQEYELLEQQVHEAQQALQVERQKLQEVQQELQRRQAAAAARRKLTAMWEEELAACEAEGGAWTERAVKVLERWCTEVLPYTPYDEQLAAEIGAWLPAFREYVARGLDDAQAQAE